jgi:hypothetical protein
MSAPENRARAAKSGKKPCFKGKRQGKLPKSTQVCTI